MTPTGARHKGFNFERQLARELGVWWCNEAKSLYRVSGSGARKDIVHQGGDIVSASVQSQPWCFCVEAKKAEGWSITNLLLGHPGTLLWHYLGQCLVAARQAENNIPLLICAANRQKPLVFMDTRVMLSYVPQFFERFHAIFRLRIGQNAVPESIRLKYRLTRLDQTVTTLEAFCAAFTRQDFQQEFVRRQRLRHLQR